MSNPAVMSFDEIDQCINNLRKAIKKGKRCVGLEEKSKRFRRLHEIIAQYMDFNNIEKNWETVWSLIIKDKLYSPKKEVKTFFDYQKCLNFLLQSEGRFRKSLFLAASNN